MMNGHRIFLSTIAGMLVALVATMTWIHIRGIERRSEEIPRKRALARELALTDLAIWTEARYTRHPSQADFFAPFQDVPSSLEHFPSGSVVAPPAREWSVPGTLP